MPRVSPNKYSPREKGLLTLKTVVLLVVVVVVVVVAVVVAVVVVCVVFAEISKSLTCFRILIR